MRVSICIMILGIILSCSKSKDKTEGIRKVETNFIVPNEEVSMIEINGHQVMACNIKKIKKEKKIKRLSDFIESCEMIKLETSEEAFVKVANTIISGSLIGVRNYGGLPYKLFNHQGEFVRDIGDIGKGPNEYTKVYSDFIDEDNDRIYLQPWPRKQVYVYNLHGEFLPPIELVHGINKANIDVRNGVLTVLNLPFSEKSFVAYQQNVNGQLLHEVSAANYWMKPDFSNEVMSTLNTDSYDMYLFNFFNPSNDTLYHCDNQQKSLVPIFTAFFDYDKIPMHAYYELPKHFLIEIMAPKKGVRFTTTVDKREFILIDKTSLEAECIILQNDFFGNIEMDMVFKQGYFINNLPAVELKERIEKSLKANTGLSKESRQKLNELNAEIDQGDNNIIFYGKLKDE